MDCRKSRLCMVGLVIPIPPGFDVLQGWLELQSGEDITPAPLKNSLGFHKRGWNLHLENKICQQNTHPLGDLVPVFSSTFPCSQFAPGFGCFRIKQANLIVERDISSSGSMFDC